MCKHYKQRKMRDIQDLYGEEVVVTGSVAKYSITRDYKKVALLRNVEVTCYGETRKLSHLWVKANLALAGIAKFKAVCTAYQRSNNSWDYGFTNEVNLLSLSQ